MKLRRRYAVTILLLLVGLTLLALGACSDLGYYRQAASGQWQILSRRQDISKLLADPATPKKLRGRLQTALSIRDFASQDLSLPDNGSYRCYADLGRPCVVWNVVAAPPFSLTPRRWCFPIAGCVPYRGYYDEAAARKFAAGLASGGDDVYVYGVTAYSTLGWFDDPVLNTFIDKPDYVLAGMIFHELAHQEVYVKGDADFNEAFAMTVQLAGVERWLADHGSADERAAYARAQARQEEFLALVRATRGQLQALYDRPGPAPQMLQAKAEILAGMRQQYAALKQSWGGYAGYDRWFAAPLNNARFVAVATYRHLVPAFTRLLAQYHGDFGQFYGAVQALAELPAQERRQRLEALLAESPA